MPIYEYHCDPCDLTVERIMPLDERDATTYCQGCSTPMIRVFSSCTMRMAPEGRFPYGKRVQSGAGPAVHVWDSERKFPNLSKYGDGSMSFQSKRAYEAYLTENKIVELGSDGKRERPAGSRVIKKAK